MTATSSRFRNSKRGPISRHASLHSISPSPSPSSLSTSSSSSSSSSASSLSFHSVSSSADGKCNDPPSLASRKTESESHRDVNQEQYDVSGNPKSLLSRVKSAVDAAHPRGGTAVTAAAALLNNEEAVSFSKFKCSSNQCSMSRGTPDLLQLFNIFEFNRPEGRIGRMMVNVTLIDSHVEAIRLRITYNATVEDVIKASLKAYSKQGRLPRHSHKYSRIYGLHYSPFSLESIDPKQVICSLQARHFFLSPSRLEPSKPLDVYKERKSWWNSLKILLTYLIRQLEK